MTEEKRKPGRPARKQDERTERFEQISNNNRPKKRVPLAAQKKLGFPSTVEKEGGMHYCWALEDNKGNLQRYIEAGYDFALNSVGDREERHAGNGEMLYLMKIPQEWYDEDYAREQEMCIDTLKDKAKLQQHEYVPMGHDSVVSKSMY